jgi:hypothetical protein
MSLKERMDSLKARHAAVDAQIQDEVQRPLPNSDEITRLKREKLRIKDELYRLSHEHEATIH